MRKRRLFLGLGLALVSLVLASCDNESKETNNTTLEPTTETTPDVVDTTLEPTTETTPEVVEKETVYICEGDTSDKTILSTQEIIKGKPVLPQIVAPVKEGYRVLNYRLSSSIDGDIIDSEFIYSSKKKFNLFVEWEKIDYNSVHEMNDEKSELKDYLYLASGSEAQQANFYQNGFVKDKMPDYSKYKDDAYVQVKTADELLNAIYNARIDYISTYDQIIGTNGYVIRKNVRTATNWPRALQKGLYLKKSDGSFEKIPEDTPWDPNDTVYTADLTYYEDSEYVDVTLKQTLNKDATVHVIEIMNDIDLGYNKLSDTAKALGIVGNYCSAYQTAIDNDEAPFSYTSFLTENGISEIKISNTNNLLIYSKNGAKITHAGFSVESCDRVTFRNLEMDELWQWEDTPTLTPNFTCGDMDVFGWAYFKISYAGYIWIDHCTFGKSYDGQIDVSNPYYYAKTNAFRAPYGKPTTYDENNSGGVHISNCKFNSGSDDKDGYLYKMMEEIEADYQKSLNNSDYACKFLYYKTLRDVYKLSFDDILYGIAIPQKKGFLLGDSSESKEDYSYHFNKYLKVSFANTTFVNLEDRIPNVRGGLAYLYNCVVDNSKYFKYRTILINAGARSIDTLYPYTDDKGKVHYPFKLALVSQAIIGGYGASICAENCIFIGISSLVKNNNKYENYSITVEQMGAGYRLVNCIWYNDPMSEDYDRIINTDTNPNQIQSTVGETSPMTTLLFDWHNESNTNPIELALYKLDNLTKTLVESSHIGVNANYNKMYLYTDALYYTEKE